MPARPDRDAEQQLSRLEEAWEKASERWRDEQARRFYADHWEPLVQAARGYLAALGQLMDVLEAAERDTAAGDLA
jgi:uncharacterized protein YukE